MFPHKRIFLVVVLCAASFSSVLAQTIIRERVEIEPKNEIAQPNAAVAAVGSFQVVHTYTGVVNNSQPSNNALSLSHRYCPISAGVNMSDGNGSVTVEAAAGGNMFYFIRLTLPEGSTGTREVRGYLDGIEIFYGSSFIAPVGPGGATIAGSTPIVFYPAMDLAINGNAIPHGGQKTLAVTPVASPYFCQQGAPVWHPEVPVTIEIVAGGEFGQFKDLSTGEALGGSFERKRSQLGSIRFVADGAQPPGQQGIVTIRASYGSVQDQASFPVNRTVPVPTVSIIYPPGDVTIELTSTNKPTISLQETHTPGPGQLYEPEISWSPGDSINTADYYDQIDDSLVIVARVFATLENATAEDSVRITLKKEANRPPVIDSLATSTGYDYFAVGAQVALLGYYHDDNDDVVSVVWEDLSSPPPPPPPPPAAKITEERNSGLPSLKSTSVVSSIQANLIASTAVTIGNVGENKFRLTVTDATGATDNKEIVIEGIVPCSGEQPQVHVGKFREDNNEFCSRSRGGVTSAVWDNARGLSSIDACLDPVRDCWTLFVRGAEFSVVYGWCPNSFRSDIQLINAVPTGITATEACAIVKDFREQIEQLRSGAELAPAAYLSNEAIVKHEKKHGELLEEHLRKAVQNIQEKISQECLSKKFARNAFEAGSILNATGAQKELERAYRRLRDNRRSDDEKAAREIHWKEIQKLNKQIEAKYGTCQ